MVKRPLKQNWLLLAALVILTGAAYARVVGYGFVSFDDPSYVYHNPHVRTGFTARNVAWALTAAHSANWHPLTWISHSIDSSIYGMWAGGHHITNVLLHALNTVLLFLALYGMTGKRWRSLFVAALFALHPLNVESVAWISERKNLLSTTFWFLTIIAYTGYTARGGWRRYCAVMLAFICGVASKPMLVTLPVTLLLLDYWPLRRFETTRAKGESPWVLVREKLPLLPIAIASSAITLIVQGGGGMTKSLERFSLGERLANALASYVAYILKMMWPAKLCVYYPHPEGTLPVWETILSGAILAVVTYLAIKLRRKYPYLAVGWFWYMITLIPVIGLVQVGAQAAADRYTYITLIGIFVIIAWGVPDVLERLSIAQDRMRLLAFPAVGILITLSVCTWMQTSYWKNTESLFGRAIDVTNGHSATYGCLVASLQYMGKTDRAIELLYRAIDEGKNEVGARKWLAYTLVGQGKLKEGIAEYKKALQLDPDDYMINNNLGTALARLGQNSEAETHLKKAIQAKPDYDDAYHNLGVVAYDQGKTGEAMEYWQKALEICPRRSNTHMRLGIALQQTGDNETSIEHFQQAVRLDPKQGLAHARLSIALFMDGEYQKAWKEIRLAEKHGCKPDPRFIKDLSARMPGPR